MQLKELHALVISCQIKCLVWIQSSSLHWHFFQVEMVFSFYHSVEAPPVLYLKCEFFKSGTLALIYLFTFLRRE